MLIQCYHTIATATIVHISQLPGLATDRTEQAWSLHCQTIITEVKVRVYLPLTYTCGLVTRRYQGLSCSLSEMVRSTLSLVYHHILIIQLVVSDVSIDDVITWVEVELWSCETTQVLIDQRIVDAMTVWETYRIIDHIFTCHWVEDDLRCPSSLHVFHIGQSQRLHIFLTLQVDGDALVPMHQVIAQHQDHDVIARPSISRSHISTSQHKLAILHTSYISISHTTRGGIFLGIKYLTTIEEVIETVTITAQRIASRLIGRVHVSIEITILICILVQHTILDLGCHVTHIQLKYIQ